MCPVHPSQHLQKVTYTERSSASVTLGSYFNLFLVLKTVEVSYTDALPGFGPGSLPCKHLLCLATAYQRGQSSKAFCNRETGESGVDRLCLRYNIIRKAPTPRKPQAKSNWEKTS